MVNNAIFLSIGGVDRSLLIQWWCFITVFSASHAAALVERVVVVVCAGGDQSPFPPR